MRSWLGTNFLVACKKIQQGNSNSALRQRMTRESHCERHTHATQTHAPHASALLKASERQNGPMRSARSAIELKMP